MSSCNAAAPPPPQPEHRRQPKSWRATVVLSTACGAAGVNLARAVRAPADLAFVVAAHAVVALLVLCLGRFEEAPTREAQARLRPWLWALSAALTAMFACRVAPAMPSPLDRLVYGLALLVTAGGFVLLFLCDDGDRDDGKGACEKSQNCKPSEL